MSPVAVAETNTPKERLVPDDRDNRQRTRRLLAGAIVIGAVLGAMLTTGTRAVWVFDAIAIAGALYVFWTSPKRRGRGE